VARPEGLKPPPLRSYPLIRSYHSLNAVLLCLHYSSKCIQLSSLTSPSDLPRTAEAMSSLPDSRIHQWYATSILANAWLWELRSSSMTLSGVRSEALRFCCTWIASSQPHFHQIHDAFMQRHAPSFLVIQGEACFVECNCDSCKVTLIITAISCL
jgi:hypothetical protein